MKGQVSPGGTLGISSGCKPAASMELTPGAAGAQTESTMPAPVPPIRVMMVALRWAVLRGDRKEPISTHSRREEAIQVAQRLAARDGAQLVIFDLGGNPLPPGGHLPPGASAGGPSV
jgi:Uncharacterized protein conserved in bacteria (DUF2188)